MLDEETKIFFIKLILSFEIIVVLTLIVFLIVAYMISNCRMSLKSTPILAKYYDDERKIIFKNL